MGRLCCSFDDERLHPKTFPRTTDSQVKPLNLLLASSSRCYPHEYLDHIESAVKELFQGCQRVIFIPYARPGGASHSDYSQAACQRFSRMQIPMLGIEQYSSPSEAIEQADGVFVGGGNTFVLLKTLYEHQLVGLLRERVCRGMPYMGTSAWSNIAGLTIGTSNDMPIVYPPSFEALSLVPININPHFPTSAPDPTFKGETRQERITEFHHENRQPVLGLTEEAWLRVKGDEMIHHGDRDATFFRAEQDPQACQPESNIAKML
ncbi:MAG: dipeptidase PepE [Planctomycetota bacterium]